MARLASTSGFRFGSEQYEFKFTADDFKRISNLIYRRAGICLPPKKADMVYNRLSRRLRVLGLTSFSAYLDHLTSNDSAEWGPFVGSLTTHLTAFFREDYHFVTLARHAEKKASQGRVKLWSCAASTGEEPYSMAITMAEQFGSLFPPVDILATDVDPGVLETARRGIYPLDRIKSLSDRIVRSYFLRGGGDNKGFVRVRPELQNMITFEPLNLLAPVWTVKMGYDAVFCRNVMIYFDRQTQKLVLQHLQRYLKADGLFFAGHSENLGHVAELFESCGETVYRPRNSRSELYPEAVYGEECYV